MSRAAKPIVCYVTNRRGLPVPSANQQLDRAARLQEEEEVLRFRSLGRVILSAISSGIDWIQVREKDAPANLVYTIVSAAAGPLPMVAAPPSTTRKAKTKIIVNDRLDVALAAQADGLHLGETSIPLADALQLLRKRPRITNAASFYVGRSCHSLESALAAERDGAGYIFFGPIFPTPSKAAFGPPQGLETLAKVCSSVRIPVVAVGGIAIENARQCIQAGAGGIAAIRLFQEASNLRETIARLRGSLETHASSQN